jgi:hypothetical protein
MQRFILAVLTVALAHEAANAATSCTKDDFAKAVDQAGAALRALNAESAPRLKAKMRQLKEAKGWPEAGFEERAYAAVQDERVAMFDAQSNELLAKIDVLGTVPSSGAIDCAKLDELTAASIELQATIKAKSAYVLKKFDRMLGIAEERSPAMEPKTGASLPKGSSAPAPRPPSGTASGWSSRTSVEPPKQPAIASPYEPPPLPAPGPIEEGYTIDEIKAVSAGFFGQVSASLARVIEHLFRKSGRPTAYVLGSEGGGAFLAGVRYGSGTLYMRSGGTQKIYWHGPSLGSDIGAEGSKTLFLIYRLASPEQLYASFTGIDGSAYIVGGVGATLVTNGTVIMAPIRSGLGLRLGANVGYIRFTPNPTWNPF